MTSGKNIKITGVGMGVAKSYETRWHVTIFLVSSMHDWDSQIFLLYSSTDDNGLFHFLLVPPPR